MRVRYGMIHGRFQPFHHGHLQYALAALSRCDHLIVGITNPDPSVIVAEAADPERHQPNANPFTFFERQWMIRAALTEAGVDLTRISIVPFPIHHPERWCFYCPAETRQFIRVFSAWGREKTQHFQERGWQVEVLDAGAAKDVSGTQVRQRLSDGRGWEEAWCAASAPGTALLAVAAKAVYAHGLTILVINRDNLFASLAVLLTRCGEKFPGLSCRHCRR